jgi:hypothetical protein
MNPLSQLTVTLKNINDDWFFPSKDELSKFFEQKDIGGFAAKEYWSSSESSTGYSWFLNTEHSTMAQKYRSDNFAVRPIRAF